MAATQAGIAITGPAGENAGPALCPVWRGGCGSELPALGGASEYRTGICGCEITQHWPKPCLN